MPDEHFSPPENEEVEIMVKRPARSPEQSRASLSAAEEAGTSSSGGGGGDTQPLPLPALPTLSDLQRFFCERLSHETVPGVLTGSSGDDPSEEVPLLWRTAARERERKPVRKIGFALDHRARLEGHTDLDALFLHRPFFLTDTMLPGIPVLASHLGFDQHLSIGYNPALADALGMIALVPLSTGGSPHPVGMTGTLHTPLPWYSLRALVTQEYQGTEMIAGTARDVIIQRIAVAGAMSPALVHQAAEARAQVFITGQYRPSARLAIDANGMVMIAVGHRRAELWGLRRLAHETARAFPALETLVIA